MKARLSMGTAGVQSECVYPCHDLEVSGHGRDLFCLLCEDMA